MANDNMDDEFNIMYKESEKVKVLDSNTFKKSLKHLKAPKPVTLDTGSSVQEALTLMQLKQFGCVLITDDEKLIGILTERDIVLKALGDDRDLSDIKVDDIMTPKPQSFQQDDSVAFVMNAMVVGGYRHIPVVDEKNIPLSVISVRDIIGFIVEHFSEEVLNLPPKPIRRTDSQDGG